MTDSNNGNTGPFAAADRDTHQDPSASSGPSSPADFMEVLIRAAMPTDDSYAALSLKFLRGGQAKLRDDDFLALYEAARATSASNHIYPGTQAKLIRNAGVDPKNATRVVGRLIGEGLADKTADGRLSFAQFWSKYPVGKSESGKGHAFMRAPAWLLFNRKALGWTPRDLRLLTLLGSYYEPENTRPRLSGAQAGDFLGVAQSQAAEDLRGLVDRAKLTPGFPVGSRTPRGYGFDEFSRFIETRVHQLLGVASVATVSVASGTVAQPKPADAAAFADFFGVPAVGSEPGPTEGGPTRRKGSTRATSTVQPDSVHEALAKLIRQEIHLIAEDQQERALSVAKLVLNHHPISPKQEEGLYRDAARIADVGWAPGTSPAQLRTTLVKDLRLWKFDPGSIAVIALTQFNYQPSKEEVLGLAMSCGSRDEVLAAFLAKGLKPVSRPSS